MDREKSENSRPWREEKRSWILYKDKLQQYDNIITDEVDGTIYILDCETARLSIWSQQWSTIADVGVRRFLQQESKSKSGRIEKQDRGARIFYKGIELQKKYIERDTELIEYIDIKKDLDRKLINLSRGGFTTAGEQYLEHKLYPGLLDSIQKVLKHLEKKAFEEKTERNFVDMICKNVEDRFHSISKGLMLEDVGQEIIIRKENELVTLLVSTSALAYFAIREEWSLLDKMIGIQKEKKNIWNELLNRLQEIIEKNEYRQVFSELFNSTSFLKIRVYSNDGRPYYEREKDRKKERRRDSTHCTFLNIFQNSNHWAILQIRKNKFASWSSFLVKLNDKFYQEISSIPYSNETEKELEKWGDDSFEKIRNFELETDGGEQFILGWMLKNIPTIGLFSDASGNYRFNVLSNQIYPSIFMNKHFKTLILKRILDKVKEENFNRVSTIVWHRMEYLGIEKLPFSIYFIKRGYLSDYSYRKMIVPFDGNELRRWNNIIEEGKIQKRIKRKISGLLSALNILDFLNSLKPDLKNDEEANAARVIFESNRELSVEIESEIMGVIFNSISEENYKPIVTFEELLDSFRFRVVEWKKIYLCITQIYLYDNGLDLSENHKELEQLIKSINQNHEFLSLCSAWYYCLKYKEDIVKKENICEIREDIAQNMTAKDEAVIRYIQENAYFKADEEDIRYVYKNFKEELVVIAQELEIESIREIFAKHLSRYQYWLSKIKKD